MELAAKVQIRETFTSRPFTGIPGETAFGKEMNEVYK
jgi:hypothetical protein